MSDQNFPVAETASINTNAEYIMPAEAKKQPPVLLSVSKAIVIETIKDFFGSIIGFFLRYIRHFVRCIVYFFKPSLQKKPFSILDFKENSQHAFEFLVILAALVVFMEKLEWIPPAGKDMLDLYCNDLSQKAMEFWFFILFAVMYLLGAAISILSGRLWRMLFKLQLTRHESGILFNYANNAFFSIGIVFAFSLRCVASSTTYDNDGLATFLIIVLGSIVAVFTAIWSVRLPRLHGLVLGKTTGYFIVAFLFYTLLYFIIGFVITSLILAI